MENQRNDIGDMGRDTGTSSYSGKGTSSGSTGMGGSMSGGSASRGFGQAEGHDAADTLNAGAAGVRDQLSGVVDYFRDNGVQDMMDDLAAYVKAHPTQALVGAAVIGFFAGRMARRS